MEAEKQLSDKAIYKDVSFNEKILSDCNSEKLYFLPKIHKQLSNVPGRPMITHCGTLQRKYLNF